MHKINHFEIKKKSPEFIPNSISYRLTNFIKILHRFFLITLHVSDLYQLIYSQFNVLYWQKC